jgi:MFS family permease
VGYCVDQYGRKVLGVSSMVILSGGLFLLGLSTGMTTVVVASIVMGLGNGLSAGLIMILGEFLHPCFEKNVIVRHASVSPCPAPDLTLTPITGGDLAPRGEDAGHFLGLWNLLMDAGATSGVSALSSLNI